MQEFYNSHIIQEILKIFKVNEMIISGILDEDLISNIFNYDAKVIQINTTDINCIKGDSLKIFPTLKNYDAIFINDDANWYTVFNQLQIIKKTNDEFPLVFICNNNFPNKRRDSYINPNDIPSSFRQNYTDQLPVCYNDEKVIINDGLYHACDENTPKNGVLTAIEDFLNENTHIGIMKINFMKEICILYLKSQINQKRISIVNTHIQNEMIDINLSDKLIENQMLISYINRYNLFNENFNDFEVDKSRNNNIIRKYEDIIRNQNNAVNLKNAQISGFESEISLKESQIKNIESKLVNKEKKIKTLEIQLLSANNDLYSMNQKLEDTNVKISEITTEFKLKESQYADKLDSTNNKLKEREIHYNDQINVFNNEFKHKEKWFNSQISLLNDEINQKKENLKSAEQKHMKQINEKIREINVLKSQLSQKESSFAKKELEFYKQLNDKKVDIEQKNNQLKLKQDELNSKESKLNYIEYCYSKQLSKIENNKYCISCFKDEISNNQLEIKYLKENTLTKKILSPFSFLYLILKSDSKEILLNLKLYRVLKDSKCFDIGFYLNCNKDLIESKWCKYFSPELHYVCRGFGENREFNKKYFNRNSKAELLQYLLTCDE